MKDKRKEKREKKKREKRGVYIYLIASLNKWRGAFLTAVDFLNTVDFCSANCTFGQLLSAQLTISYIKGTKLGQV